MYALADVGASVNLMPYDIFKKLDIRELQQIRTTIELSDGTIKIPKGIYKNLLIKIGKFVFPADFLVMEIENDYSIPLILGRPFLATTRAILNLSKVMLTLQVGEEESCYTFAGIECFLNDPIQIYNFFDENLNFELKNTRGRQIAL